MKLQTILNKAPPLVAACLAAAILSACTVTGGSQETIIKTVDTETLANGTEVQWGNIQPTTAWGCMAVANTHYRWSILKSEGQFTSLNADMGGTKALKKKALAYASANNLKINYIYYTTPTTISGVAGSAANELVNPYAYAYYYQCQTINPPKS